MELAASFLTVNEHNQLCIEKTVHFHIQPFEGANLEEAALKFTGIDPYSPLREAVSEKQALQDLFSQVRQYQKK